MHIGDRERRKKICIQQSYPTSISWKKMHFYEQLSWKDAKFLCKSNIKDANNSQKTHIILSRPNSRWRRRVPGGACIFSNGVNYAYFHKKMQIKWKDANKHANQYTKNHSKYANYLITHIQKMHFLRKDAFHFVLEQIV